MPDRHSRDHGYQPDGADASDTANFRSEQIERSAPSSLLKKPADEGDCADIVVTMCRTETMTGQTVVIDAEIGRAHV